MLDDAVELYMAAIVSTGGYASPQGLDPDRYSLLVAPACLYSLCLGAEILMRRPPDRALPDL